MTPPAPPIRPDERLIIALDVDSVAEAQRLVEDLDGLASFFKVGLELFVIGGTQIVDWLTARDKKVFLDLKFNDVPETVTRTTRAAARLGVNLLTVHGDAASTVRAAVAGRGENSRMKILAVTVLTSFNAQDIKEMGFRVPLEELALGRAKQARELGCDGVVASAREAAKIREAAGPDLLIVTPGIRPKGVGHQDQKRVMTPHDALSAGADYLVVGRAITAAPKPRAAAESVLAEMRDALAASAS